MGITVRSGKLHLLVKFGKREAGIDFRQRDDGVEPRVFLHREAAFGLAALHDDGGSFEPQAFQALALGEDLGFPIFPAHPGK